jgi:cytoskeletal protein RodZ
MKSFNLVHLVRAIALALTLGFAPFAMQALAQTSGTTTTTQSSNPTTQSSSSQTTQTTTTRETSRPSGVEATPGGINTLYLVIGGIALLAILLIVLLSARGRSRGDTVVERRTVVKKD